MFRIVRSFSLAVLLTLIWICAGYAQSVPMITGEFDDDNMPPGHTPFTDYSKLVAPSGIGMRENCDPDMMEIMNYHSWLAGQREITQNANIYVRPDSVLSLTCFDKWLSHQATYAKDNFPGDPDDSEGLLFDGVMTDCCVVYPDDKVTDKDPNLTMGYVQYGMLEILVLDQLMDVGSGTGHAEDFPYLKACGGKKEYYIQENFPTLMIGGRAANQDPDPVYSSISAQLGNEVDDGMSYNCARMAQVWDRTRCYDFATEDNHFYKSGSAYKGRFDHDGFYTYTDYVNSTMDFRAHAGMCDPYKGDLVVNPPADDMKCWLQTHGQPANVGWYTHIPGYSLSPGVRFPGGGPSWKSADMGANLPAGSPGTGDAYPHYLDLTSGSVYCANPTNLGYTTPANCSGDTPVNCAPPIRTGFMVMRKESQYYDAVCPNPGCFFTAPKTLAGKGQCSH